MSRNLSTFLVHNTVQVMKKLRARPILAVMAGTTLLVIFVHPSIGLIVLLLVHAWNCYTALCRYSQRNFWCLCLGDKFRSDSDKDLMNVGMILYRKVQLQCSCRYLVCLEAHLKSWKRCCFAMQYETLKLKSYIEVHGDSRYSSRIWEKVVSPEDCLVLICHLKKRLTCQDSHQCDFSCASYKTQWTPLIYSTFYYTYKFIFVCKVGSYSAISMNICELWMESYSVNKTI